MDEQQKMAYFKRSYTAVDGLWFMKVEEKYGFEAALEIDNEVWRVFPKIQARKLKSILELGEGMDALKECLAAKHTLENFIFEIRDLNNSNGLDTRAGFQLIINQCPWYELMVKSGRETLAGRVGTVICNTEYAVWAGEFDKSIHYELKKQICKGDSSCILEFVKK